MNAFNFPLAPPSASNFAAEHDALFYTLCALTAFFTLIVAGAVIYFSIRYRHGSKADRSRPIYEDLRLELSWTIIPAILGLFIFYWGAHLFISMRTPPKNAEEIFVIGKQWMWHSMHQNGVRENNTIHVPVGKPVKLTMISQDVLHAMYIPAFRVQMHVVPGRYTGLWFTATKAGEYHLFCNMYCGTQHSEMGGKVVAMEPAEYAAWLANGGNSASPMTVEQSGQKLFNKIGCNNCHGAQDSPRGPSLIGLFGKKRQFSNAPAQTADEAYIRESIVRPYNKLTIGYGETMPVYPIQTSDVLQPQGQLTEEDLISLVAYIKSMGSETAPVPTGTMSRREAVNRSSSSDNRNNLAVGALRTNTEDPDATPTIRKKNPAVGAIAAEGRNE